MNDHREYMVFNQKANTATCTKCHMLIYLDEHPPKKVGGDESAIHAVSPFGASLSGSDEERLDVFRKYLDGE